MSPTILYFGSAQLARVQTILPEDENSFMVIICALGQSIVGITAKGMVERVVTDHQYLPSV